MPIKLLITDVDGCLTSEDSVPFELGPFDTFAKMCRDAAAGQGAMPPVTLCTGRPQPYVEVLAKLFDIRLPMICENGAVIYTLADNRAHYGPGVTEEKIHGLRRVRAYIEAELLPRHPSAIMQFGKEAQLSVFSERPETLPPLGNAIHAFVEKEGGPALDIIPSHFYLNISLSGVNKGRAIEWLLAREGLHREEVAGIGDTVGDMPLRQAVGYFACPANSQEELKAVADYVSPHAEVEGVLDIIQKLHS